jgi:hypothetical protein
LIFFLIKTIFELIFAAPNGAAFSPHKGAFGKNHQGESNGILEMIRNHCKGETTQETINIQGREDQSKVDTITRWTVIFSYIQLLVAVPSFS